LQSRKVGEEEITASRNGDSAERRTLKANYSAALCRDAATLKIQSRSGKLERLFISASRFFNTGISDNSWSEW
jgi:hypothetical protein